MPKPDMEVAVETLVHAILKETALRVWEEHSIRIDSVEIEWDIFKQMDGKVDAFVYGVHMKSSS